MKILDSPLYEPLHTIGLDDSTIRQVIKTLQRPPHRRDRGHDTGGTGAKRRFILHHECSSLLHRQPEEAGGRATHAARLVERVAQGGGTQTWQADHEERTPHGGFDAAFNAYLQTEAKEAFGKVMDRIFQDLKTGGQSEHDAKQNAIALRPHTLRAPVPCRAPGVEHGRPDTGRKYSEIGRGWATWFAGFTRPAAAARDTLAYGSRSTFTRSFLRGNSLFSSSDPLLTITL